MKLNASSLSRVRHVLSAILIVAGAWLSTMTGDLLAGSLLVVLGVFIEMAAISLGQQDSTKQ